MCKGRVRHAAGIMKMRPAATITLVGEQGWTLVRNDSDETLKQESALTRASYTFEPGVVRFVDVRDLGRLISYKINGVPAFVEVDRGALNAVTNQANQA